MSKEITYKLKYREKGEEKETPIKINFVSNYCNREFSSIIEEITSISNAWKRINIIMEEKGALVYRRTAKKITKDEFKTKIKAFDKEEKKLKEQIEEYSDNDFFKRRFNLIAQILEDNSVDDEMLTDFDFWDRKVDPSEIMAFLSGCVYKDLDTDKQGGQSKKLTTLD